MKITGLIVRAAIAASALKFSGCVTQFRGPVAKVIVTHEANVRLQAIPMP